MFMEHAEATVADRRRSPRLGTTVHLLCRIPATPCSAVVRDVSQSGCRLEIKGSQPVLGGTAMLEVPGARAIACQVVWVALPMVGLQFERPLARQTAIALGLEQPDPEPVQELEAMPEEQGLRLILQHWMRRLTGGARKHPSG